MLRTKRDPIDPQPTPKRTNMGALFTPAHTSSGALSTSPRLATASAAPRPSLHSARPTRNATIRGFTLLELLTILVITGLLAYFLLPRFGFSSALSARAYAEQSKALIRYAQKSAIAQRRWAAVNLAANPPTLCTQNYSFSPLNYPLCAASCTGGSNTTLALPAGLAGARPSSTSLSGNTLLCFDAQGRPFASGSAQALTSTASLNISDTDFVRSIMLAPETGYVR